MLSNHPELKHKLAVSIVVLLLGNLVTWNIYLYNKVATNEREVLNLKVWVAENYAKKTDITTLDSKLTTIQKRLDQLFNHLIKQGKPHE
ncbi:hypothetical protein [Spartinivicinus ruber]|uniref:hypothetical protein n=1 Tax=Spartinivicinus ruber TaxID=2683272 RepID=UPI0013D05337|nr:hypothetical protein [Spartinivicinus ruber]